jgi:hypothetical protein
MRAMHLTIAVALLGFVGSTLISAEVQARHGDAGAPEIECDQVPDFLLPEFPQCQ